MTAQQKLEKALFISSQAFLYLFLLWVLYLSHRTAHLIVFSIVLALVLCFKYFKIVRNKPYAERLFTRTRDLMAGMNLSAIISIGVILRLAWGFHYWIIPLSDFRSFYNQANSFSFGKTAALGATKSPVTVAFYGAIFKIFGSSMLFIYLANAALAAVQLYIIYRLSYEIYASKASAKFSALLLAFFPSLVMFSSVVASEMLFTTILLILLLSVLKFVSSGTLIDMKTILCWAVFFGFATAALHLTRNVGILIGLWLILSITFTKRLAAGREKAIFIVVSLISALIFLIPQIKYNYNHYGVLSINSSNLTSLNLLMGTNQTSNGSYNVDDFNKVTGKYKFKGQTFKAASRYARRLAKERIMEDPIGFMAFAFSKKFLRMWCNDDFGPYSIQPEIKRGKPQRQFKHGYELTPTRRSWQRISNLYYHALIFLVLCSLLAVTLIRNVNRTMFIIIAGVIFIVFFLHLFIEVRPRYHFYISYLFCILAGGFLSNGLENRRKTVSVL